MSGSESLPPNDPVLARLFAAERDASDDVPEAVLESLTSRLSPVLDPGATPGAPGANSFSEAFRNLATLGRGLALLTAGAGIGAAAHAAMTTPRVEVRVVERIVWVEAGAPTPQDSPSTSPPPTAASVAVPSTTTVFVNHPPPARDELLAKERAIIESARSALARRDPDAALDAVGTHARTFPKGQLSEEREALAIQALVLAKRSDEARARVKRFREHYPTSFFLPVVEAALANIP